MKTIKKYIAGLALGVVASGAMMSCSDTLEEKFYNPDRQTDADFTRCLPVAQTPGPFVPL